MAFIIRIVVAVMVAGIAYISVTGFVEIRDAAARQAAYASSFTTGAQDGPTIYRVNCSICHGHTGEGLNQYPSFIGNANLKNTERTVKIILNGIKKTVKAGNLTYDLVMPPWKDQLTPDEIAAVATYVRTTFANSTPVSLKEVKLVMKKTKGRTTYWTSEELK